MRECTGPLPALPVLWHEGDWLAIHKPAGWLVHRTGLDAGETRFVVQTLRDELGQRVFPVHRLDKGTSGVLLMGLSTEAARDLAQQFARGLVRKRYLAVVRSYRLVTNILDPQAAPVLELAALYHERWEIEGVFDEIKTHMRSTSTVLRSKTPPLVEQELWGLLLAHFAVRQLMEQAAWQQQLDPDRLSSVHALRVIKRKMPQAAAIPP